MTENKVERSSLSSVDIVAYPEKKKGVTNHANLFFKDNMIMATTEDVPNIGLNNCRGVEVHSQDPKEVIVTSSDNCTVHVYSDVFSKETPIRQSNSGDLSVDQLHNNNCKIVYHPKNEFPSELARDACSFYKDGKVTAQINAQFSGRITNSSSGLIVGSRVQRQK